MAARSRSSPRETRLPSRLAYAAGRLGTLDNVSLDKRHLIAAFHAARRRSEPPYWISAASWNRGVAALEKFYGWAVEEGLVATSPLGSPIAWRTVGRGRYIPAHTSQAREPGARRGDLRFIGLDLFLLFRDVACAAGWRMPRIPRKLQAMFQPK